MAEETEVSLESLGNGAAVELFSDALGKVLNNIVDINTDPKAVREVTLKVKIKPNEDREVGQVQISTATKLAPIKSVDTVVFIGRRGGQAIAVESNPKQPGLFNTNVAPLKEASNAK
jgi:hypothetical protein